MIRPDIEKQVDSAQALEPWFARQTVYIVPESEIITVAPSNGDIPVYSYNGHNGTGEITHYNLRS